MNENDTQSTEQNEPASQTQTPVEPIHTDAEVALLEQVNTLRQEIAGLREENRKLFLRLGGEDKPEKTADDEIAALLSAFRESGYDPSELMKE